jgi:hypothetical protein
MPPYPISWVVRQGPNAWPAGAVFMIGGRRRYSSR